jgi:hypothetical protein
LIVDILEPVSATGLSGGKKIKVKAEVRMLWGCILTPGGLWDSDKLEIWGQWVVGDTVLEKFVLTYAGSPSRFEGETSIPERIDVARLQLLAADQAGNFGQHGLLFRISPWAPDEVCEEREKADHGMPTEIAMMPDKPFYPKKIVSGDQTGVDRAALDLAIETGIPCGGWCPEGRLAEDERIDNVGLFA